MLFNATIRTKDRLPPGCCIQLAIRAKISLVNVITQNRSCKHQTTYKEVKRVERRAGGLLIQVRIPFMPTTV